MVLVDIVIPNHLTFLPENLIPILDFPSNVCTRIKSSLMEGSSKPKSCYSEIVWDLLNLGRLRSRNLTAWDVVIFPAVVENKRLFFRLIGVIMEGIDLLSVMVWETPLSRNTRRKKICVDVVILNWFKYNWCCCKNI